MLRYHSNTSMNHATTINPELTSNSNLVGEITKLDYPDLYALHSKITLFKTEQMDINWIPSIEYFFDTDKPQYAFGNLTVDQKLDKDGNTHIHFAPLGNMTFDRDRFRYEADDLDIAKMALIGYEDLINLIHFYENLSAGSLPIPKCLIAEASIQMGNAIKNFGFEYVNDKDFAEHKDPRLRLLKLKIPDLTQKLPTFERKFSTLKAGLERRGITLADIRAEEIISFANNSGRNEKDVRKILTELNV